MIADVLLVAVMTLVGGGIGLPLAYLLPERYRWRPLIAPVLGFAVLSVVTPVAYRWGLRVPTMFWLAVALGCAGVGFRIRWLVRDMQQIEPRTLAVAGLGWLACVLVLMLPRWVGGDQFAVFQGNPWDQFAYHEASLSYARKSYATLSSVTDREIARFPMYALAQTQLGQRPAVNLLYAIFSRVAPDEAYRLHYPFLVFFFSQFVLVAMFALRSLTRDVRVGWCVAVAAVFPLGFWGQYVFDINAWSQIASVPLLFLMFALLLHAALGDASVRTTVAIAVLVAGNAYLYPEGFIVYAAATFPLVGALPLWRMIRERRLQLRAWIPLLSLAGLATSLLYTTLPQFLIGQVTIGTKTRVPWWQFFQAFFKGRDNGWDTGVVQKIDFSAGLFGLYFATPASDAGDVLAIVQRIAIALAIIAVLLSLAFVLSSRATVVDAPTSEGRSLLRAWTCAGLVMLLPAVHLFRDQNYWPAGKVLSYATPVLMTLLCVPVLFHIVDRRLRPLRWIVIGFVLFQLGAGAVRAVAARSAHGIHYAPPYPAVAFGGIKQEISWDLTALEDHVSRRTRVLIHPSHMWLEHGLAMFMFARRVPYVRPGIVNTYFGDGQNLEAPPAPWKPDIEIRTEGRSLVLQFSDGRPEVRLPR